MILLQEEEGELEKLKPLLEELKDKKDKLDETASDLPKIESKPIVDEKFKDLEERFEKLDNTFTDKKKQVFQSIMLDIIRCTCPHSLHQSHGQI